MNTDPSSVDDAAPDPALAPPAHSEISDAELRMHLAPGIGPVWHERLIQLLGCADAVVDATMRELALVEGIGATRAERIWRSLRAADPDLEREQMARSGVRVLRQHDPEYPALLTTIPDAPPALWVRGAFDVSDRCSIAVVGARRCTSYGREQASVISFGLAECGFTIVSGGARGVDAAAHRAALRAAGRTIVVSGCGLGYCYPPEHVELFEAVAACGAVVSELPMASPPRAECFPRRNRIISGFSIGVVVVEAAMRSGALITAREAAESHGREVMALPGRADSLLSAGCHRAIREGWAGLVTGTADILAQLEPGLALLLAGDERRAREMAATSGSDGGHSVAAAHVDDTIGPGVLSVDSSSRSDTPSRIARSIVELLVQHRALSAERLAASIGCTVGEVLAAATVLQLCRAVHRTKAGFALTPIPRDGPRDGKRG